MKGSFQFEVLAVTDTGVVREGNEDQYLVWSGENWEIFDPEVEATQSAVQVHTQESLSQGLLLAVADGMGGMAAGEVASQLAVSSLGTYFDEMTEMPDASESIKNLLFLALKQAHQHIADTASRNSFLYEGMGTTAVAAWIIGDTAYLAWSGDSRAYIYDEDSALRLCTEDHSVVWEMVQAGEITQEEARVHPESNLITQSLGEPDYPPEPDFVEQALAPGDRLLLCSDGLHDMLSHEEIQALFEQGLSLADLGSALIQAANEAGGDDNISVILCEMKQVEELADTVKPLQQEAKIEEIAASETPEIEDESASEADASTNIP